MVKKCRIVVLSLSLLTLSAAVTTAQPSHVEQLQQAGIACLDGVLSEAAAFVLDADERAPYLRPALVAHWNSQGKTVFRSDSLASQDGRLTFQYRVDNVRIELAKARRGSVSRTAFVDLRYTTTGSDGHILEDNLCSGKRSDTVTASLARQLADPRYPETNIEYQHRSWLRRMLEPAVVIGAAVIGTYLFFNLRSKRTEGG